MLLNTVLYGFLIANTSALLFLSVYILITLSDLDCDHLNPTQCCNKLRKWIIPEVISFGISTCLILLASRWFLYAINLLALLYFIYTFFVSIPTGGMGFYDPLEIHLDGNLKRHLKVAFIRLLFHLVHFFIFLYLFIISMLTGT